MGCALSGEQCEEDSNCAVVCFNGVCTARGLPITLSDADFLELMEAIWDQLFTPESIAQMYTEEMIEKYLEKTAIKAKVGALMGTRKGGRALAAAAAKNSALRSTRVAAQGSVATAASTAAARAAVKSSTTAATRQGINKAMTKLSSMGTTAWGYLYFAVQVIGMVLDVDDAAGFNAQVPQGGVDLTMKKMLATINEFPEMLDVGVQFPREYLPEETLEWAAATRNEVATDRHLKLTLDYLDHLVINSNGERIVAAWDDPVRTPPPVPARNPILWKLSGNVRVYAALTRWWPLILTLGLIILLAVGIGLGLGLSNKRRRRP